jgi:hypothetical protein
MTLASAITDGDLVVLRVGDGSTVATGGAFPVTLDEYTVTYTGSLPTGVTFVQSIAAPSGTAAAPTTGNRYLQQGGNAAGEGGLEYTNNGSYLVFAGYNQTNFAAVNSGSTTTEDRVIGRVDKTTGVMDTSTAYTGWTGSTQGAAAARGASSADGVNLYLATSTGVRYGTAVTDNTGTGTNVGVTNNARRNVVYNGQLYESEAATSRSGVEKIGTGTPTNSGNTITLLPGFSTTSGTYSPYDFFFADDNTLYFADDRGTGNGGLEKWSFNGTSWVQVYNHPIAAHANAGLKGLSGYVNNGNVTLFATTVGVNANFLMGLSDTLTNTLPGSVSESTLVDVAVNPGAFNATGTQWNLRGVAILPPANTPEPGSLSVLAVTGLFAACRRRRQRT